MEKLSTTIKKNNIYNLQERLTTYSNIIFDIGDVILSWTSESETHNLRQIIKHPIWKDYEKGILKKENAFTLLSSELGISYTTLETIISNSTATVTVNKAVLDLLIALKQQQKKLICLTNMDRNSFLHLYCEFDFWEYFDLIYTSSFLSLSKPDIKIFQYVIHNAHINPNETVFLDNKTPNLHAATQVGIHTVKIKDEYYQLSKPFDNLIDLMNLNQKKILKIKAKGYTYLHARLQKFPFCKSYVSKNIELTKGEEFSKEIFSTIVILHTNSSLPNHIVEAMINEINAHSQNNFSWCFYKEDAKPKGFPDDLDTTAMILSFLLKKEKIAKEDILPMINQMISNRNDEGVIQVYFDTNRPRIDAAVAVNVLYLMCQINYNNQDHLKATRDYVYNFLKQKKYLNGTRYYPSPDVFLFFLSRLVSDFPEKFKDFTRVLKSNLISQIDTTSYPLERALRIIALKKFGIVNRIDFTKLLDDQLEDGGWAMNGLFIAAKTKEYFGSRELTSSFAIEAIESMT